jgi:hypothetical protein
LNSPASGTAPDFDLRAYLQGNWSVDRTLLDRFTGARGTFTGVVRYSAVAGPDDDGVLHFREEGTVVWTTSGGAPFTAPASREYLLRPSGSRDTMDMFFPDGRPFHRMGFGADSSYAQHWCDPDSYRVSYTLIGPDEFRYRWDVTGPAKDQLLESVLRRVPGPDA